MCYGCQTIVNHIASLRRKKRQWLYWYSMTGTNYALRKAKEYTQDIQTTQAALDARRPNDGKQSDRIHQGSTPLVP